MKKMTISQQIKAVRANPFSILEIETPHIAAVITAVHKNPQLADNVVRKMNYDYIAKNFYVLERLIVAAAKQSNFAAKCWSMPWSMLTHSVYAAMKTAGADVGKYPEPKSSREVLEFIS